MSKPHRCLLLTLLAVTALALFLREHGYSLSLWAKYLTPPPEGTGLVLGKPRFVRADDWMQGIPFILAERAHRPPYPIFNRNLGLGSNMMAPFKAPIAHPVTFFRPSVWGFLLGPDFGLSWMWWFLSAGLFYVYFLVLLVLTRHDFGLSLVGSFVLWFSPYFQFWSFQQGEAPIAMGIAFLALTVTMGSRHPLRILGSGLLLGWALASFVLGQLYPPIQVNLAYLLMALSTGFFLSRASDLPWREQVVWRGIAVAMAAGVIAFAGLTFYRDAKPLIALITQTVYPGIRFSTGGTTSLFSLFSSHFFPGAFLKNWAPLGNICESASFFLFLPWVLYLGRGRRLFRDPLVLCLVAYLGVNLWFALIGFPGWLAKATLFSKIPAQRTLMGTGLADLMLFVIFLSRVKEASFGRLSRIALVVWLGFLVALGAYERHVLPELTVSWLALAILGNAALMGLLLFASRAWFLAAWALISFGYTAGFNPVMRGGSALLFENPLSREIKKIDEASQHNSLWVTFSRPAGADDPESRSLSNLFRVLGVRALDGVHNEPQLALWKWFDPEGRWKNSYNQIGQATVYFEEGTGSRFGEFQPNYIYLYANPGDERFWNLGVTHYLVVGSEQASHFDRNPRLEKIYAQEGKQIYRLVR